MHQSNEFATCPRPGYQGTNLLLFSRQITGPGGSDEISANQKHEVQITEAVLLAAAEKHGRSRQLLNYLLDRHPTIQITESLLTAAVSHSLGDMGVVKSLLARGPDIKVTMHFTYVAKNEYR